MSKNKEKDSWKPRGDLKKIICLMGRDSSNFLKTKILPASSKQQTAKNLTKDLKKLRREANYKLETSQFCY